jgi:hypothetical protein
MPREIRAWGWIRGAWDSIRAEEGRFVVPAARSGRSLVDLSRREGGTTAARRRTTATVAGARREGSGETGQRKRALDGLGAWVINFLFASGPYVVLDLGPVENPLVDYLINNKYSLVLIVVYSLA